MKDKVTAAKNGVNSMLMYYHQALSESGCSDPRQVIATNLAEMIKLSDAQKQYIIDNSKGLSAQDILKNILILLTKMEKDKEIDKTVMSVIKQNINVLQKMVKTTSEEV